MPRWKDLPEELDPQVKEFTDQLRRLVDRSGLGVSAVADRTGYSKTSWERYLNGRLLAPKGAVLALAEATGTNAVHLTTMWELAERAWSRSEMRHDMTMEAIRISQARAALGGSGRTAAPAKGGTPGRRTTTDPAAPAAGRGSAGTGTGPGAGSAGTGPGARTPQDFGIPRQPTGREPGRGPGAVPGPGPGPDPAPGPGSPDGRRGHRKVTMFLAGVVGTLLVIAAAVLLTGPGGEDKDPVVKDRPTVRPATSAPELPLGVECSGDACTGKDPETMGCGGEFARTTASATVGTSLVEVRYSRTCGAAWARITRAAVGDTLRITGAGTAKGQNGLVDADRDAYTPMIAVAGSGDAKACATLASGAKGCTPQE
ncbi:DUF2690 domain-containing protein [Streptomyces altiplanensis]